MSDPNPELEDRILRNVLATLIAGVAAIFVMGFVTGVWVAG